MNLTKANYLLVCHTQWLRGALRGLLLPLLLMMLLPATAWAANELETVLIDGKSFYILRTSNDWEIFKTLINKNDGKEDMNAIMDGDFTITSSVGMQSDAPYVGTFDGNGHTLNANIKGTDSYISPFSQVRDATFKNLHVTGTCSGGQHSSGLIGSSEGVIYINNCWVSVTVNCSNDHVGGFVGHGHKAKHSIDNCLFDGKLISEKGGSNSYGGAFVGWEDGGTSNVVTHSLENGTFSNFRHTGMNYNTGTAWSGGSNNWSYHNWGEVNGNVVGTKSPEDLVTALGRNNWQVVNGKVVPKMEVFPKTEEINLETYDAVPSTNQGELGSIQLPITCDRPMKYVDATYTDSYGNTQTLKRTSLEKDSYFTFLLLPGTEMIKDLNLTVKLDVGTISKTLDKVPMIHGPHMLKAEVDSVGGVKLMWKVFDRDYEDLLDGDVFQIQRSLTGKEEDFKDLESDVTYDSAVEDYLFRDSTLISALSAANIDKELGIPLVRYRVYRMATKEIWGMDKNPTVAYAQPQFATLTLLVPKDAQASWSKFDERKAKVIWNWTENDTEHNYVWDERAELRFEVKMYNREGQLVDSITTIPTDEQFRKREMELTLNRSCVTYSIRMVVDGSKSPIGKGEGEIFTVINSREDFEQYANQIFYHPTTAVHNAIMTADVTIENERSNYWLGFESDKPFTGNLNGNGHTLTVLWPNNAGQIVEYLAPIRFAGSGAVICNLTTAGTTETGKPFSAGLVGKISTGKLFIENCISDISFSSSMQGDATLGGFVGVVDLNDGTDNTKSLYISNCLYKGRYLLNNGTNSGGFVGWRRKDTYAMISNSYFNPSSIVAYNMNGSATFMRDRNEDKHNAIIQDCSYGSSLGQIQGKSGSAPQNWCWNLDKPDVKQVQFSKPTSGSTVAVLLPADKFYYENLGHIDRNSLTTDTLQTSVMLEWALDGEEPVDYFEVWRREVGSKDSICIATQLSEMYYEDKTVSIIRDYEYMVRGVNDCEGLHYDCTKWVPGNCVKTGLVEGYVLLADGTGVPDVTVTVVPDGATTATMGGSAVTDESGHYRIEGLPYWSTTTGAYTITTNATGNETRSVEFDGNKNSFSGKNFTVSNSVKFTGFVLFEGTSIPVQNVGFKVDGKEVKNASGKILTDYEGRFAFRILPGKHSIQAFKDGHEFYQDGFYMANDSINVDVNTDKSNVYFYDNTRVTLIGRVAGGKDQAAIPLGNSLSKNNLGNDLKMVFVLEGDKTSKLVFDNTDLTKKVRDEVFQHVDHDDNFNYQTRVHTTQYRMEVTPDVNTGEYMVKLPPVKWKIQQITAQGYATLFQDGQTGEVIDLTDSIVEHTDYYKGAWLNATKDTIRNVEVKYHAQYSRIYRTPILLERKQVGFGQFDYFGDRIYTAKSLVGDNVKVPLVYQAPKKEYLKDKEHWVGKDSLEVKYTFGYPVFNTDRGYPFVISAVERYYYNNNVQNDTVDIVKLDGGFVTIRNGLISGTQRDTLSLDENGEGYYVLRAAQKPYLVTGNDALSTVTFSMERDGVTYEGEPLKAFTLSQYAKPGAKDYLSVTAPLLVDVLRDPPGGGSSAKLSKGSTLKLTYQMDMSWKAGLSIDLSSGTKLSNYTGLVGPGIESGLINMANSDFNTSFDLIFSGSGQRAFSYTMTANEDISTDGGSTMVGANADLYMGVVTNNFIKPTIAVRAIPDSTFIHLAGNLVSGRMVEIANGIGDDGGLYHLVRDEAIGFGQRVESNFIHSQQYIVKQLIPSLAEQSMSLIYEGKHKDLADNIADAQTLANSSNKRIYLSLRKHDDERFGQLNIDPKTKAYVYNSLNKKYSDQSEMNYLIVAPTTENDAENQRDEINEYANLILGWAKMIQQNEQEKVEARELVKNFDVDGGGSFSYSEDFASDYTNSHAFVNPATSFTHNFFSWSEVNDNYGTGDKILDNFENYFPAMVSLVGTMAAKAMSGAMNTGGVDVSSAEDRESGNGRWTFTEFNFSGTKFTFKFTPVISYGVTPKQSINTKYNRKESFTIKMDKKSHLNFDVLRVKTIDTRDNKTTNGNLSGDIDVFLETDFERNVDYVKYFLDRGVGSYDKGDFVYPKSFVYRTRGGATVRPWENERKTNFYRHGTLLDERTKKIENPIIKMDKQSVSGVPFEEPARFKLYMTNESEQPEAIGGALQFFTLYLDGKSNPKGARLTIDGMPLSTDGMTIKVIPGEVTEKTLEVWAGEDFDYENLTIGLISQGDVQCVQEVSFSVHYLRQAGAIAISSPGDKWIMNTDAPYDSIRGWYMPIIISGFNKNQHNFDHIEFQYKESTRGDDYWTNLCGYYKDKELYDAASGTKSMIPENGYIITRFYGEGQEMEKGYDLRAVLFCRNGNSFITNASKVLSGVKDTRRPQLFGSATPKDGILGPGDNIIFNFSEEIEHNYLSRITNFEVVGETNETTIHEEPALLFSGKGYVASQSRRNFTDKNVSIDVMVKPDKVDEDMPIFSHGTDGHNLQLWVTKDRKLKAVVNDRTLISKYAIDYDYLNQVALVLDNTNNKLYLYNDSLIGSMDSVTYSGYGTLIFGSTNQSDVSKRSFYKGRMIEGRIWNRVLDQTLIDTYGKHQLTGYEMGLTDYYPMNEGEGLTVLDMGVGGADMTMTNADWALPRGMSLKLDRTEKRDIKGLQLQSDFMARTSEQDYTLMFWFKTDQDGRGALLSNGSGNTTDVNAANRFFIGFEGETLKYRTNGDEYKLGDNYSDDHWHHYAMTVNRSLQVCNIYIDNVLKASFMTDHLGGMTGNNFFLGNMVWQESGPNPETKHSQYALTGYIDELCLFKQALPTTLIKRFSKKSPRGNEKGLITYLGFNRQERTKQNELELFPYALNQVITTDEDGIEHPSTDSIFVQPVAEIVSHIDTKMGAPVQPYEELKNLNFSFVGKDNQLLVNIDELDKKINKRTVYVTVTEIPDKNGNYMASPATESFFVNRNPLKWDRNTHTELFPTDYQGTLFLYFSNNSGSTHTYTIDNIPRWLTADKVSDVIDPQEERYVCFTISKDMNPGSYDHIIYLTDENGLSEPMKLEIIIEGDEPRDWIVNQNLKRYSMNVVGQVSIGDAIVTDSRDIVAVFDNDDNCMGRANIEYNAQTGLSMVFLTIYNDQNTTPTLNFRLWHYDTGKTMLLETPKPIKFGDQTFEGTVKEPLKMTASNLYIQHLNLIAGWNWISFNVKSNALEHVDSLLNLIQLQEGDIFTEDTQDLTLAYKNGMWMSNSDATDIHNISLSTAVSYRVKTQNDISVAIYGTSLSQPADRVIHVKEGWNSIGYTPLVNLPVATALGEYWNYAKDGDIIKSQHEFAVFYEGSDGATAWMGSLKYMKPGDGYMLYRQKPGEVTFRYPFYEPGSTFIDTSESAPHRSSVHRTTMTVVAEAIGVEVMEGDRLIAYANGEQVGEAVLLPISSDLTPMFFLSISGDMKVPLTFTLEREGSIIATAGEVMDYQADAIKGSLNEPTQINFTKAEQLSNEGWWSLQGFKLNGRPTQSGVYIFNGKKQVIK